MTSVDLLNAVPTRDRGWLEAALAEGRLVVHYQPIVSLPQRRVVGVEALARLRAEDGTLLRPDEFIPIARACGLIGELDNAVLEEALDAVAEWRTLPGASELYVAVNVTPGDLDDRALPDRISAALRLRKLPQSALMIEVVESELLGTDGQRLAVAEAIAAAGVRIALDDFGTGFATLENLHRLPVSTLKIDRLFVGDLLDGTTDAAIVRAVIDLADALELDVVAEGVETEEQADRLTALGCAAAQGWFFGAPRPRAEVSLPTPAASPVQSLSAPILRWSLTARTHAVACARVLSVADADGGRSRADAYEVASRLGRCLHINRGAVEDTALLALLRGADSVLGDAAASARAFDRVPGLADLMTVGTRSRSLQVRVAAVALAVVAELSTGLEPAAAAAKVAAGLASGDPIVDALLQCDEAIDSPVSVERLLDTLSARAGGVASIDSRLRVLATLARGMASVGSYVEVLALAAEEARRTLGAASVSIMRHESSGDTFRVLCNVGYLAQAEVRFPEDETYRLADLPLAARLFASGIPLIQSVDDEDGDEVEHQILVDFGRSSSATAAITVAGERWGALYATSLLGSPPFSSRDLDVITACASFVSAAIEHAQRLERVERLAFEDPLTGLANRRAADEALAAALAADGSGCALVVVDVNAFKGVNDQHGHAVGDRVLRAVADALTNAVAGHPLATVCRIGGDEFCVVLPGASEQVAMHVVRAAAEQLDGHPEPQVRIAGGVALGAAGSRPQEVFMAADAAQYVAKRQQIVVASDRPQAAPTSRLHALRRARRGRSQVDVMGMIQMTTLAVAALPDGHTIGDRLHAVAGVAGLSIDLNRWAISKAGADGILRIVRIRVHRARVGPPNPRQPPEDAVFQLNDYPETARVVRQGGTFQVDVNDEGADEAERGWLRACGLRGVLGAGVPDGAGGGWLLELATDTDEPLAEIRPVVALVASMCAQSGQSRPYRSAG